MKKYKNFLKNKIFVLFAISFIFTTSYSEENIQSFITDTDLSSANVGICMQDLENGKYLLQYNDKKCFIPASITKLFTSSMALNFLGENFCFETSVFSNKLPNANGVLKGNLFLYGSGDPTIDFEFFATLANKLIEIGIKTIDGKVVVPNINQSLIPHVEWEDLTWYYAPQISWLAFEENSLDITIKPSLEIGKKAYIYLDQKVPYCKITNKLETSKNCQNLSKNLKIKRALSSNRINVWGNICSNHPEIKEKIAIYNPTKYARLCFIRQLKNYGIEIKNKKYRIYKNQKLKKLCSIKSPNLKEIIKKLNKESNNFIAEMLFLKVGSIYDKNNKNLYNAGSLALKEFLKKINIFENFQFYEGSGISRHNLVTPRDVLKLLNFIFHSRYKNLLKDSLSIAGKDGTLKNRFVDTFAMQNIFAKTGSMSGISNIAGYATCKSGRKIAFCVLVNNFPKKLTVCRKVVDQMVLDLLDNY